MEKLIGSEQINFWSKTNKFWYLYIICCVRILTIACRRDIKPLVHVYLYFTVLLYALLSFLLIHHIYKKLVASLKETTSKDDFSDSLEGVA